VTIGQRKPFAARLLKRLVPAQDHDALLGDLHEERQRGRSRVWYIVQILAAIVVGSWKDIRTHRLLTLGSIGIGVASLVLYFYAGGMAFNFAERRLYDGILIDNHWIYWRPQPATFSVHLLPLLFFFFVFLVSGWVIGRLSRAHGITFVVAFAVFLQLLFLALIVVTYILVVSHIMAPNRPEVSDSSHTNYLSPLWMSLCIVIGGYFATRRGEAA
jgi:hypothetical protein